MQMKRVLCCLSRISSLPSAAFSMGVAQFLASLWNANPYSGVDRISQKGLGWGSGGRPQKLKRFCYEIRAILV
jgi:hypothetical protein